MAAIVTLTTDFGLRDSFVGAVKGVVLSRCPEAQLVDITHDVPPQDVRAGAMRLAAAAKYFPAATVHLAVVDPGVGTARRPIAVEARGHKFVGPDNGLLALAAPRDTDGWRAVVLTRLEFWLPEVSATFHGRDVFAPVAAHLACGGTLDDVGEEITSFVDLALPRPIVEEDCIRGVVLDVDHYGNVISNIGQEHVQARRVRRVEVAGVTIEGLCTTYDAGRPLVALVGSAGLLEIAAPGGSAADRLGISCDEPLSVHLYPA